MSISHSHANTPPIDTSNQPAGTFSTQRLQLAIYLHAAQTLPFLRCEASETGKVRFVFEDSNNIGSQVELEFDRGAAVAATAIFASQKFLRRKMSEALNSNRRIETIENHRR